MKRPPSKTRPGRAVTAKPHKNGVRVSSGGCSLFPEKEVLVELPAAPEAPDPICAKACGACWACMRKKHGPDYWWKGAAPAARTP